MPVIIQPPLKNRTITESHALEIIQSVNAAAENKILGVSTAADRAVEALGEYPFFSLTYDYAMYRLGIQSEKFTLEKVQADIETIRNAKFYNTHNLEADKKRVVFRSHVAEEVATRVLKLVDDEISAKLGKAL